MQQSGNNSSPPLTPPSRKGYFVHNIHQNTQIGYHSTQPLHSMLNSNPHQFSVTSHSLGPPSLVHQISNPGNTSNHHNSLHQHAHHSISLSTINPNSPTRYGDNSQLPTHSSYSHQISVNPLHTHHQYHPWKQLCNTMIYYFYQF